MNHLSALVLLILNLANHITANGGYFQRLSSLNVTLGLYTSTYQIDPIILADDTLGHLNGTYETKIIIHGYRSSARAKWVIAMKDEYLTRNNHNIIAVDWSAHTRHYVTARSKIDDVCGEIGAVLNTLIHLGYTGFAQVHAIGHSLGSHCGGHMARRVQRLNRGSKIRRLTCLDPSILGLSLNQKVDKSDAYLVDVIHTSRSLGLRSELGHLDFYPNGGGQQPGCPIRGVKCSHQRAYQYWIESIGSTRFVAVKCEFKRMRTRKVCNQNAIAIMGEHLMDGMPEMGSYYLETNDKPPFAKG